MGRKTRRMEKVMGPWEGTYTKRKILVVKVRRVVKSCSNLKKGMYRSFY